MVARYRRLTHIILAWTFLTLAWCAFVIVLAGRLHAQEPCPSGTISVDRYGFICLPGTAEAFGDVAGGPGATSGDQLGLVGIPAVYVNRAIHTSAATPRIILAHQKLASDAWVDRSKNKKGERCCDSGKDCYTLNPEYVKHVPGGVNVLLNDGQVVFVPGDEIMPSEDGRIWVCFWGSRLRCLFMPYSGS